MSFRYDVINLDALNVEPIALKNAKLEPEVREAIDKCTALQGQLLDWLAEGKFTKVIVRGVEYKLVKS